VAADGEPWDDSDARVSAGLALLRARQFYAAILYFRKCLAEGASGPGWFYLGAAQHALGQLREAALSFGRAAEACFRTSEARSARATVLAQLGLTLEAKNELRAALRQDPAHPGLRRNLAILLEQRGELTEALALYGDAIRADPSSYAARLNRGAMRLDRGEPLLALEDFDALLPAHDRPEVHGLRARALFALHRDGEALVAADRVLALAPRDARAWLDRILALSSQQRFREAQLAVESGMSEVGDALLRLPNGPTRKERLDPVVLYIDRALQRQDVCAWHDRDDLVNAVRVPLGAAAPEKLADPGILFRMLALPLRPGELKAVGAAIAKSVVARTPAAGWHPDPAVAGPRMRIGFLSPEFRAHPAAWLMRRFFLDRDREQFEFLAYALNAEDGSAVRSELAGAADAFLDMSSMRTEDIIARMRADRLDVLIDNSGFFAGTRPEILAARVAPVQAGWMGIACTLGPGLLDYRISDALTTPLESQDDWYEKLALVPAPHAAYDADQLIGQRGTRASHGLPEQSYVFACFNQAFKLDPDTFGVWMRLLRRVAGSALWLLDNGPVVRDNLSRQAARAGVAPERLVFAPRVELAEHLGRMHHADLFLDTRYYGAHTTAADALSAGLPVLTCPGETMAARLAATFVRCAGIGDLAVDTLEAYESKAIHLAENPVALSEVRARLAAARTSRAPFFAATERVRAMERAVVAMVQRHRAGLPPETLIID
jgi:predicted O-linked N-acetylglucosamine transferase (SPINDLY family)